jgi:hypothetical protein
VLQECGTINKARQRLVHGNVKMECCGFISSAIQGCFSGKRCCQWAKVHDKVSILNTYLQFHCCFEL